jgi:dynein heavy chain
VDKFNKFLSVIESSLRMLEKAIKGAIPMNTDLDEMSVALENNYIPRLWSKYCYETLKPLASWHTDFKNRVTFLEKCFSEVPSAYWISCFFFPQGLLTAFLQTHARKHKIPIDTLSFKFKAT